MGWGEEGEKRETYRGPSHPYVGSEGGSMVRGWGGSLHSLQPRGNRGGSNTWGLSAQDHVSAQTQARRAQALRSNLRRRKAGGAVAAGPPSGRQEEGGE